MVDTAQKLRTLNLSALEVRNHTGWSDAMVSEWLDLVGNIFSIAQDTDVNTATIESVENGITPPLQGKFVPYSVDVTADHETGGEWDVLCLNMDRVVVSLNPEPKDREEVRITRTNAGVNVSGNGKLINGQTDIEMIVQWTSLHFIYYVATDYWVIS